MPIEFKLPLSLITLLCTVTLCPYSFAGEEQKIVPRIRIVTSQAAEIKTSGGTIHKVSPGEVLVITQSNQEWLWAPLLGGWIKNSDVKEPEALVKFLNKAIEDKPTAERYHLRGIAYQVLKNYEAALVDFDASLKIKADNAHIHVNRGNIYRLQQEYKKALTDLNRAIQLDQSSANAFYIRGLIYFESQDTQKAIEDLSAAIRINGSMISALNARGIAYREQNQLDLALQDFNQAIQANNFVSEVFSNRATLWEQKKLFESAIKDYKRAIELNPSSAIAHNDLAWLYATCSDSKFRNSQAAVTHAQKACEFTQFEDWNLLDTLATSYRANQDHAKAVESLRKAIQKAPSEQKNQLKKKLTIFENM